MDRYMVFKCLTKSVFRRLSVLGLLGLVLASSGTPTRVVAQGAEQSAIIVSRGLAYANERATMVTQGSFYIRSVTGRSNFNLLSKQGIWAGRTSAYRIQAVPPGEYGLISATTAKQSVSLKRGVPIRPTLSIGPGEVVYLGDISVIYKGGKRGTAPTLIVTDRFAEAESALAGENPGLAARMTDHPFHCPICLQR